MSENTSVINKMSKLADQALSLYREGWTLDSLSAEMQSRGELGGSAEIALITAWAAYKTMYEIEPEPVMDSLFEAAYEDRVSGGDYPEVDF
jgi:hypothetical protein